MYHVLGWEKCSKSQCQFEGKPVIPGEEVRGKNCWLSKCSLDYPVTPLRHGRCQVAAMVVGETKHTVPGKPHGERRAQKA